MIQNAKKIRYKNQQLTKNSLIIEFHLEKHHYI